MSLFLLHNTKERWFGNQFLPTAPKLIIVRVYEREIKGLKERMRSLTVVDVFVFFLQPVLGPAFGSKVTTPNFSHPLMPACLWPIRASDWLVILFHWFCQLYVNVLSLYTAWPGVVCVPCTLATYLYNMSEREDWWSYMCIRLRLLSLEAVWECVNLFVPLCQKCHALLNWGTVNQGVKACLVSMVRCAPGGRCCNCSLQVSVE